MVVVLIIAILIAIAIPTFLGARTRAQDKASQSNLRNGITAAKTVFVDGQDYSTGATPAALIAVEPSLVFQAAASTQPKEVSINAPSASTIYMASMSKSGTCWAVKDVQAAGGAGTSYAKVVGACLATDASVTGATYADSF